MNRYKNMLKQTELSFKELAIFKKYKCEIGVTDKQALKLFNELVEQTTKNQQEIIDLNLQIKYTKELIFSKISLSKNNLMADTEKESLK